MTEQVVMCVTDGFEHDDFLAAEIRRAGFRPLVVEDWDQAVALYFINRRLDAVVLDQRQRESAGMCRAQALRSLRADIPILLLSSKHIDPAPKGVDACVCFGDDAEKLGMVLHDLLKPASPVAS